MHTDWQERQTAAENVLQTIHTRKKQTQHIRQAGRQTDLIVDCQTGRQRSRHTDRQTGRHHCRLPKWQAEHSTEEIITIGMWHQYRFYKILTICLQLSAFCAFYPTWSWCSLPFSFCSSGDIGGQMGLFIGASVLTILEIFDYLYEVWNYLVHVCSVRTYFSV